MSNHAGSYLLNEVLRLLEERGVFTQLGRKEAQRLVLDIVQLSHHYDCNSGEILDEIGQRVGICSWCLAARSDLVDGVCVSCRGPEGRK
jgi:recombinational DNA repair protein RecR